jgi:hypothetical protein
VRLGLESHFFNSRKELVKPFMEGASERCLRNHHIQSLQTRNTGHQVPIDRTKTVWINTLITHGNDDVAPGTRRLGSQRPVANDVFVCAAAFGAEPFEATEGRNQELRLPHETRRTSIVIRIGQQLPKHETLERVDVLSIAAKRVVEVKNFGDELRSEVKGWSDSGVSCSSTRDVEQHVTFGGRQRLRRIWQPLGKPLVHLSRKDELRQHDNPSLGKQPCFDGSNKLRSCRTSRNDYKAVTSVKGHAFART